MRAPLGSRPFRGTPVIGGWQGSSCALPARGVEGEDTHKHTHTPPSHPSLHGGRVPDQHIATCNTAMLLMSWPAYLHVVLTLVMKVQKKQEYAHASRCARCTYVRAYARVCSVMCCLCIVLRGRACSDNASKRDLGSTLVFTFTVSCAVERWLRC